MNNATRIICSLILHAWPTNISKRASLRLQMASHCSFRDIRMQMCPALNPSKSAPQFRCIFSGRGSDQ